MRSQRNTALLLCLGLLLCAGGADAGIGDMIKNKVKAIKGAPKAKTAAETGETGEIKSRMTPPVTPEAVAKFEAALRIEKAEREKVVKFLASLKTPEAYNECKMKTMQSPEAMALNQRLMDAMDAGQSQEEIQKKMTQLGGELEKMIEAKCGKDPGVERGRQGDMIREAFAKGSDAFEKDDNVYNLWKEWVLEFCKYIEKLKEQPDADQKIAKMKEDGLRIPGSGTGIYWVYTATEVNNLLERCDDLVPLIEATM